MFDRVLVPLDGSEAAEGVLPPLRRLLIGRSPEILILRVVDAAALAMGLEGTALESEAESYVRRIAAQFTREGRRCRSLVRSGGPASTILRTAREEEVSLLALSTHGRRGLARLGLGSIAEAVLRDASAPVFLVRSSPCSPAETAPLHSLLVPLDGSDLSRRVLPFVRDVAHPLDARVTLLRVNEPPGPHPRWLGNDPDVERDLRSSTIPVTWEVRDGDPIQEILEACRTGAPDLLVMATHGRSGPVRWLLGSVTESVLRSAEVPMLVVPSRARAPDPAGPEALRRHP